jgi:hypothetical protein
MLIEHAWGAGMLPQQQNVTSKGYSVKACTSFIADFI